MRKIVLKGDDIIQSGFAGGMMCSAAASRDPGDDPDKWCDWAADPILEGFSSFMTLAALYGLVETLMNGDPTAILRFRRKPWPPELLEMARIELDQADAGHETQPWTTCEVCGVAKDLHRSYDYAGHEWVGHEPRRVGRTPGGPAIDRHTDEYVRAALDGPRADTDAEHESGGDRG